MKQIDLKIIADFLKYCKKIFPILLLISFLFNALIILFVINILNILFYNLNIGGFLAAYIKSIVIIIIAYLTFMAEYLYISRKRFKTLVSLENNLSIQIKEQIEKILDEVNKALTNQSNINNLVNAHIDDVVAETDKAAFEIIDYAQSIDKASEGLKKEVEQLQIDTQNFSVSTHKSVEDNQETISMLKEFIKKREGDMQKDLNIANIIKEKAQDLIAFISSIEDIAKKTKLLAFNASIEAARAGAAGNGFDVVAKEIAKLSDQSNKIAKSIGKAMESMQENIESQLSEKTDQSIIHKEQIFLLRLESKLNNVSESYQLMNNLNSNIIEKVSFKTDDICNRVLLLLSNIQFQDITRQQMEKIKEINELVSNILTSDEHIENKIKNLNNFDIDQFKEKYIMEKQRITHDSFQSKETSNKETKVGEIVFF
ncbi:MAG: methyl-accepting chemotaxis protein [Thermoplasmata archaeon]